MKDLTEKDLELLNSKKGKKFLLQDGDNINLDKALRFVSYEKEMKVLQEELIKLQNWVINNDKKVLQTYCKHTAEVKAKV